MSEKQNYQVPVGEENLYHLRCIVRRHIESEKRYVDDEHIVKQNQREYKRWDQFKEVNGYSSVTVLHDPTSKAKEPEASKFPVVYLGKKSDMSREEIKEILEKHKVTYFKGAKAEKLTELVSNITPDE